MPSLHAPPQRRTQGVRRYLDKGTLPDRRHSKALIGAEHDIILHPTPPSPPTQTQMVRSIQERRVLEERRIGTRVFDSQPPAAARSLSGAPARSSAAPGAPLQTSQTLITPRPRLRARNTQTKSYGSKQTEAKSSAHHFSRLTAPPPPTPRTFTSPAMSAAVAAATSSAAKLGTDMPTNAIIPAAPPPIRKPPPPPILNTSARFSHELLLSGLALAGDELPSTKEVLDTRQYTSAHELSSHLELLGTIFSGVSGIEVSLAAAQ